jgi:Fe(3+) dicitrate transport protein
VFINASFIDAEYIDSEIAAFDGKQVELVPDFTLRTGLKMSFSALNFSAQYSRVSDQFSDATNVGANPDFPSTPNAVDGLIPAYQVLDLGMTYALKSLRFSFNCNNLLNAHYFTRRASGYPGPGIIPSDGRSVHLGIRWSFDPRYSKN